MQAVNSQQQTKRLKEWYDLWFDEHKRAGYVAVTDFKKQYFYGSNDVERLINATIGKERQFISINAFDVDWENKVFSRETARLKQIRNIAIDLDQYKLGLTVDEVIDELKALILDDEIPEPNLVLISRGIQLFYTIDKGASPSLAWLAGYITEQFISKLQHIGADSNAKDMSRVMRVPNSINERNNSVVKPYIWNDEAYTLQKLQAYCRPLDKFSSREGTKKKIARLPSNLALEQYYKTNYARRNDLLKLFELRNGDFTGCRDFFIYILSYHQSLILDSEEDVFHAVKNDIKGIYTRDPKAKKDKVTDSWIRKTVRSAYKDAEGFFNHFKANGYRVVYQTADGVIKPYKTDNIIKMLNITEEEQRALSTLRSARIAKEQHAKYMRNKRRSEGVRPRQEYENERKQRKEMLMKQIKKLREQGLKQKEIAEIVGISQPRVSKILKELKNITGV